MFLFGLYRTFSYIWAFLVFRPIVYKPLWDTFVFRFEFYETVSFLSSLEVLPRTTDPYLWISDSKWRIFLTYLGISPKWREFLSFRKPPNRHPPFSPFVLGFIPIFFRIKRIFTPKSETILHHLVIRARFVVFCVPFRIFTFFLPKWVVVRFLLCYFAFWILVFVLGHWFSDF